VWRLSATSSYRVGNIDHEKLRWLSNTRPRSVHLPAASSLFLSTVESPRTYDILSACPLAPASGPPPPYGSQYTFQDMAALVHLDVRRSIRTLTSVHFEVPISDSEILAVINLSHIQELGVLPVQYSPGSKFWGGLTPKGTQMRKQGIHCCPLLRILVLEVESYTMELRVPTDLGYWN